MKDQVTVKDIQVGGTHYKDMAIQPIEYITKNNLGYCEGNVIKYVSRWKNKNGVEDLLKARHYIDLLIDAVKTGENESNSSEAVDDALSESNTLNLFSELEKYNVSLYYDNHCGLETIIVRANGATIFCEPLFQEIGSVDAMNYVLQKIRKVGNNLVKEGVTDKMSFVVLAFCLGCFNFRGPISYEQFCILGDDIFRLLDNFCGDIVLKAKRQLTQFVLSMTKEEMTDKFIVLEFRKEKYLDCFVIADLGELAKSEEIATIEVKYYDEDSAGTV